MQGRSEQSAIPAAYLTYWKSTTLIYPYDNLFVLSYYQRFGSEQFPYKCDAFSLYLRQMKKMIMINIAASTISTARTLSN